MTEREQKIVTLAENVMGWRVEERKSSRWARLTDGTVLYLDDKHVPRWNPYENIADAWMIVEKMREKGHHFLLMVSHESGLAIASFYLGPYDRSDKSATMPHVEAPAAICRAALRSLEAQ